MNTSSQIALVAMATLFAFSSTSAFSQDVPAPGLEFEIGGGALISPSFEGSKNYSVSPYPVIRFGYLALDNGFVLGGGDGQGLSIRPSFRYLGARKASDYSELTGIGDVDAAIELGGGFKYGFGSVSVFSDIRYGVTGHNGLVGEFGADYVAKVEENTTLTIGPRVSWASNAYMDEYFSVNAAEAVASGLSQFDAGSGFKSVGVEAAVRYDFAESWAVEAGAGYNRLVGDAANSPIAGVGAKNQFTGKIGIVRKFNINF